MHYHPTPGQYKYAIVALIWESASVLCKSSYCEKTKIRMSALPIIVSGKYQWKALRYSTSKTPMAMTTVEHSVQLGPHEMLVQTKAVSLNPADILFHSLAVSFVGDKSKAVGSDFAGVVLDSGANSKFKKGDEVYGCLFEPMTSRGVYEDFIVVNDKKHTVMRKPRKLSFVEAASLPAVIGTPYQCLIEHENLKSKNVLVLGAGTSVGTYGIQLAKQHFGAKNVVATCSSSSTERVKSYGADYVLDYTKGDQFKIDQLNHLVEKIGKFDIILDTVRDEPVLVKYDQLLKNSKQGGVFSRVGGSSTNNYDNVKYVDLLPSFFSWVFSWKAKFLSSYPKYSLVFFKNPQGLEKTVEDLVENDKLQIVIDSVFDKSEFLSAYAKLKTGKAKGKIVAEFK